MKYRLPDNTWRITQRDLDLIDEQLAARHAQQHGVESVGGNPQYCWAECICGWKSHREDPRTARLEVEAHAHRASVGEEMPEAMMTHDELVARVREHREVGPWSGDRQ